MFAFTLKAYHLLRMRRDQTRQIPLESQNTDDNSQNIPPQDQSQENFTVTENIRGNGKEGKIEVEEATSSLVERPKKENPLEENFHLRHVLSDIDVLVRIVTHAGSKVSQDSSGALDKKYLMKRMKWTNQLFIDNFSVLS
jgi:hypothetical protein